jgi:hypothetical protein
MVWFTSLDEDYGDGWLRSSFIFLFDSRNVGQSFVWWLV